MTPLPRVTPLLKNVCPDCKHLWRMHTSSGCAFRECECEEPCCASSYTNIGVGDDVYCSYCGSTLRVIDG